MNKEKQKELYHQLLQAIVDKQKEILGVDVAVNRASKVDGLELTISGEITAVNEDPEMTLESLVNEYYKLTAQAGLDTCVQVIHEHTKKNTQLELPHEIEVLLGKKD